MNPVVVIPSYWTSEAGPVEIGRIGNYDHATEVSVPMPELELCLQSLEAVRGILRVIILLVAPKADEDAARARVDSICRAHASLNCMVVGTAEARLITKEIESIAPRLDGEAVSLRGYGAIRNMGLCVASALGHDVVVFLDDDELALSDSFLLEAVYGMGQKTRQGLTISAKSGYYLTQDGSPFAAQTPTRLRDRFWSKREEFNQWMKKALSAPRISRSNYVCGGCFAVGVAAFSQVAFDPNITRGEDLDYLFNLRLYGMDVWFDNTWFVRHVPPPSPSYAHRFLQDVYRWEYEVEKIAAANARIGLRQVRPEALRPYPSEWISPTVSRRIALTSLMYALFGPERISYLRIFLHGRHVAKKFAVAAKDRYVQLQTHWPRIISDLWDNTDLAHELIRLGVPKQLTADSTEDVEQN